MGACFSEDMSNYVEQVVCKDSDLVPGKPIEVKLEDKTCLLVKDEDGQIQAVSGKCTHYGASLAKGAYKNGRIRCPWHGACFNVASGDIEDFPGLDSLQKFQVSVDDDGDVKIKAPRVDLAEVRRTKPLCKRDPENKETIIVVGGGPAAQACVETLRQDDRFTGRLVMLTKEADPPYDRPKLSKAMNSDAKDIRLRSPAYYSQGDIEVRTNSEVTRFNHDQKRVEVNGDEWVSYDKLVLSTGTSPRNMSSPGSDLKHVYVLRTPDDAKAIVGRAQREDSQVVIIGTSFIGMEVAAFLVGKNKNITVVGTSAVPFAKSLGEDIGRYIMGLHEKKGVRFEMSKKIAEFVGNDEGEVSEVVLSDGARLPADLVVLGIGVVPNTGFLRDSGLAMTEHGYITVDDCMRTNLADVYAAGDVASFPLFTRAGAENDDNVNIGHYQLAHAHGRHAALNLAGENATPIRSVPFFWTVQFGKSLRYAGHAHDFDDIVFDGDVEQGQFAAYYCKGGDVLAVATLMRDPLAAEFANLLQAGKTLAKDQIQSDWRSMH